MKKREFFKIEGDRINRLRKHCPKCGPGVFLAEHKNRFSCGKCGYTEFMGKGKQEPPKEKPVEMPVQDKSEPPKDEKPMTEISQGMDKPKEVESVGSTPADDSIKEESAEGAEIKENEGTEKTEKSDVKKTTNPTEE
jgi:small subunit ribosomal protein S27Ae